MTNTSDKYVRTQQGNLLVMMVMMKMMVMMARMVMMVMLRKFVGVSPSL